MKKQVAINDCAIRNVGAQAGFSLIELMIAIAIVAILIALASPSFTSIINSNKLTGAGNEVLATLQTAKIEAIRRNANVVFCASNNADSGTPTCTNAGVITGHIAFVDDGGATPANARNGTFQAGETLLRASTLPDTMRIQASNAITALGEVTFRSDGLAYGTAGALLNGSVSVCLPITNPAENARVIQIGSGSRISISRFDAPTDTCPAPNN